MLLRGQNSVACAAARMVSVAVLLLALSACITVVEKPVTQALLYTTRAGDTVTLSWKTKPGEMYAVHYADSRSGGAKWNVLAGCERVSGTGQMAQKTDHVAGGAQRYYRLIVVPAK